jgi:hypothetical protein
MAKKGEKQVDQTETKAPGEVPAPENKALVSAEAQTALATPAESRSLSDQLTALGASPSLVKRAVKAAANFALMETPKIPRIKAASDGLYLDDDQEDPTTELTGVILFGAKYKAFYAKDYDPSSPTKELPDCFSHNGQVPEPDVKARQNPVCKTCPKNQFETAKMGKGKACRDLRRLFLLQSVEPGKESIMPLQFNVTPTSIKNWDEYLGKLVSHGFQFDEVITKITAKKKSRDDKYVVLSFAKVKTFGEENPEEIQTLANISALKTLWMPYMERQHVDVEETLEETDSAPKSPAEVNRDY